MVTLNIHSMNRSINRILTSLGECRSRGTFTFLFSPTWWSSFLYFQGLPRPIGGILTDSARILLRMSVRCTLLSRRIYSAEIPWYSVKYPAHYVQCCDQNLLRTSFGRFRPHAAFAAIGPRRQSTCYMRRRRPPPPLSLPFVSNKTSFAAILVIFVSNAHTFYKSYHKRSPGKFRMLETCG